MSNLHWAHAPHSTKQHSQVGNGKPGTADHEEAADSGNGTGEPNGLRSPVPVVVHWSLPAPPSGVGSMAALRDRFIPTQFQKRILAALECRALTADQLQGELGVDRKQLYRDGLKELKREGKVKNHRRVGYYRPDAPPPEYADVLGLKN